MSDFIFMSMIFSCGTFVGLVAGAFFAASRDADDFDGGFTQNNPPPARTIIYSKHVEEKDTHI